MNIERGMRVKYSHYGEEKTDIVDHLSRDGSIVFLSNGRWVHAISVTPITRAQDA